MTLIGLICVSNGRSAGQTVAVESGGTGAPPGNKGTAAAGSSSGAPWRWALANTTRVESWHFFEPRPGGGDPDYAFLANRLRFTLTGSWPRVDFSAAVQYVQFGGLPTTAVGPGALGSGALYYAHAGRTDSRQVYLRTLSLRAKLPHGVSVLAGRINFGAGAESPTGIAKVDAVKRSRVESRLIGEFEWSLFQRTFDGVRGDVDRRKWHLTAAWVRPTQGGFEDAAGAGMKDLDLGTFALSLRPGTVLPATEVSTFAYLYDDRRQVSARPDNSGLPAASVDVSIPTFGAALTGATASGTGEADWLFWFAGQTGSWFGESHRAWALVAEAGYQWKSSPWQPWLRGGIGHASGDEDGADGRHGTFVQMVPTGRKFSYTASYAFMNLRDLFAELVVRPAANVTARADLRRLWLASPADRWYAGSGATQSRGTFFGFAGRPSGGHADFGTVIEGSADVAIGRHLSVNAFLGAVRGGRVVQASFDGRWLTLFYVESVIGF